MTLHIERPVSPVVNTRLVGVAAMTLLVVTVGTASGQTARTFKELRGPVTVGDGVTVEDDAGRGFRGSIRALDDDSLTLRTESAQGSVERAFTENEVTRV